jgi:hypothetical protein
MPEKTPQTIKRKLNMCSVYTLHIWQNIKHSSARSGRGIKYDMLKYGTNDEEKGNSTSCPVFRE